MYANAAWIARSVGIVVLLCHCFHLSNVINVNAAATAGASNDTKGAVILSSLVSIRDVLERQEDTIIFSLIERAKFPINSKAYQPAESAIRYDAPNSASLAHLFIQQTEALQARFGRYENPEETPFFPAGDHQPDPPIFVPPSSKFSNVLHPAGASVNASGAIWEMYTKQLLPLFTAQGDDANYASSLAADLTCLQALARRIHYGRFVAEAKFRAAPAQYIPLIRSRDKAGLIKLLTDDKVEALVKQRVAKKAMVFGQDVTAATTKPYKVDPAVVSRLYGEWVIPLTKLVELQYLLRRLDN